MTQRRLALPKGTRSRTHKQPSSFVTNRKDPFAGYAAASDNRRSEVATRRSSRPVQWTKVTCLVCARFAERVLACLVFLVALPVLVFIALAVLVFTGRPVFYRQNRVGKDGVVFRIWKFRTMRKDAESKTGPVWCAKGDERITRLGRILRASHLDELPQLLNILAGDMRIVGPRPERPEFVEQLGAEIPRYQQRLRVHPGVTGLAQIRQGYDTSIADVRRKVAWDLVYIKNASFLFDLYILAATLPFVAAELLGHVRRVLKRDRSVQRPVMTHRVIKQQVARRSQSETRTAVGIPHVIRTDLPSSTKPIEQHSRHGIHNVSA